MDFVPEHSRRARGFPIYAALRTLGRSGVADLVERSCPGRALAQGLAELPGCEILNDVVLNQVLLRFEDDEATDSILAAVQASGEAWTSGTTRNGRKAIRLSVSSWKTSEATSSARSRRSRPRAPSTRSQRGQEAHRARRRTATTAAPRRRCPGPRVANVGALPGERADLVGCRRRRGLP